MAFYKKQPTAFTQGNKGKRVSETEETTSNSSSKNPEADTKNWDKQKLCTQCGNDGCSCEAKVNDWENKA